MAHHGPVVEGGSRAVSVMEGAGEGAWVAAWADKEVVFVAGAKFMSKRPGTRGALERCVAAHNRRSVFGRYTTSGRDALEVRISGMVVLPATPLLRSASEIRLATGSVAAWAMMGGTDEEPTLFCLCLEMLAAARADEDVGAAGVWAKSEICGIRSVSGRGVAA